MRRLLAAAPRSLPVASQCVHKIPIDSPARDAEVDPSAARSPAALERTSNRRSPSARARPSVASRALRTNQPSRAGRARTPSIREATQEPSPKTAHRACSARHQRLRSTAAEISPRIPAPLLDHDSVRAHSRFRASQPHGERLHQLAVAKGLRTAPLAPLEARSGNPCDPGSGRRWAPCVAGGSAESPRTSRRGRFKSIRISRPSSAREPTLTPPGIRADSNPASRDHRRSARTMGSSQP